MEETVRKLSRELNLPEAVILKVYKAHWLFIKTTIEGLQLKEDIDEETFKKLKINFNIPNLGKLACTYDRYVNLRKSFKIVNNV